MRKELNNLGLKELNQSEIREINGGCTGNFSVKEGYFTWLDVKECPELCFKLFLDYDYGYDSDWE